MNYQEPEYQLKNVLKIMVGATLGGLLGYAIMEIVIDRLIWGKPIYDDDGEDEWVPFDESTVVKVKDDYRKPPLSELVRGYNPNPMDSDEPLIAIISKDEVEDSFSIVNVETITYFSEDQTYVDENQEIIENPNDILVPNAHLHFGEKSDSPDTVYIWNGHLKMFYEVVSVSGAYAVEVLGEEEKAPVKKKPKRSRRPAKKPQDEVAEEIHDDDGFEA